MAKTILHLDNFMQQVMAVKRDLAIFSIRHKAQGMSEFEFWYVRYVCLCELMSSNAKYSVHD